jgi:hypothetical protein
MLQEHRFDSNKKLHLKGFGLAEAEFKKEFAKWQEKFGNSAAKILILYGACLSELLLKSQISSEMRNGFIEI